LKFPVCNGEKPTRRVVGKISSSGKRRIYVPSGLKVKSRRVHFNALVERPGTPRLFESAKYFRSHAAFLARWRRSVLF